MNLTHDICTGCSVCEALCPKTLITMSRDSHGFLYPLKDVQHCTECELCKLRCPINTLPTVSNKTDVLAGYALDTDLLDISSSGAIFPILSKEILNQGGIVFGASFNSNFDVVHICAESEESLRSICGSKYVQSRIDKHCYERVKSELKNGRLVYFSGMSCQIAALKNYLSHDYENLITQDTICHSVPSPLVWRDYISELERSYGSKLKSFSFRHKQNGWENYYIRAEFENGKIFSEPASINPYQKGFIKGLFSRESCFSCKFRGLERASDITLADFWGVKNILPEAYNKNGTSLIMLHSEKGKKLLDKCNDRLELFPVSADTAFSFNPAAFEAIKRPAQYDEFWKHYSKEPFDTLVERCCMPTMSEKFTEHLKSSIFYRGLHRFIKIFLSSDSKT